MPKVLITGASGLVANALCVLLIEKGYDIVMLSTKKSNTTTKYKTFFWDIQKEQIDQGAFSNIDYIIHLAGANIGQKRWTKKRKIELVNSRVASADLLFKYVQKNNISLKAIISASAVGYYGIAKEDKILTEQDVAKQDFLSQLCQQWEDAVSQFAQRNVRYVQIRTGIVLSESSSLFSYMLRPMRFGWAFVLASGKQYMPWIHIEDLCMLYVRALELEQMQGAYNAVAPEHITNYTFTSQLASMFQKKIRIVKMPALLLKLFFGEKAKLLLSGNQVSSVKSIHEGFQFKYPTLKQALHHIFSKKNKL
ncbi:MAG: TIGR01777 family oxidoreductase [Chitinophagaceae bacterium]